MRNISITLVFFLYGLAFFTMGVVIVQEVGRCTDARLRHALRFLAAFGLLHGIHEWLEMFQGIGPLPGQQADPMLWEDLRILLLAFSFLPLSEFGVSLMATDEKKRRLSLLVPLTLAAVWSFGLLFMGSRYSLGGEFWDAADVWTRYVLAIPGALLACIGLIFQQRAFRQAGMAQFGQDSLWAAVAFAWYGLIGQMFPKQSSLPPSTFLNSDLFQQVFGFQVQLMRAFAAILAAVFVIRFMRSFEVETRRKIAELQSDKLEEAQRREAMRGELLRQVVAAQEAERQRIARELHDETGQSLTAIGLGLRGVSTHLQEDSDKSAQNLRRLEGLVSSALNELQRLIADLRPSHLDDLGLAAALRWYTGEIQNRTPLKITMEIDGDNREIPAEVRVAIFRVAQEALNNVIRHAQASQAWVRLYFSQNAVTLLVEDNGCGFDTEKARDPDRPAWGLIGMEERASLLGGSLVLHSNPGQGTRVQVTIPYLYRGKEAKDGDTPGIGG